MIVAHTLRRKTKMTPTTRKIVRSRVRSTSETEARIVVVRSDMTSTFMLAGIAEVSVFSVLFIESTVVMTFAPGCLNTTRKMPRFPFVQAA